MTKDHPPGTAQDVQKKRLEGGLSSNFPPFDLNWHESSFFLTNPAAAAPQTNSLPQE